MLFHMCLFLSGVWLFCFLIHVDLYCLYYFIFIMLLFVCFYFILFVIIYCYIIMFPICCVPHNLTSCFICVFIFLRFFPQHRLWVSLTVRASVLVSHCWFCSLRTPRIRRGLLLLLLLSDPSQ